MTLDTVFIDLDNTILDFYATEKHILGDALAHHGIEPTPAVLDRYKEINLEQWLLLEQGVLGIDEVSIRRFALLIEELGHSADAKAVSDTYESMMENACFFMPGAKELLEELSQRYRLCLVTNGMGEVQHNRIRNCGVGDYFDEIFVSSDLGCVKPNPEFFEACFSVLGEVDVARCVMIGDGLNADMRGGIQMGMRTIWYNPLGFSNQTEWQPDAVIASLKDVPLLLEVWENEDI